MASPYRLPPLLPSMMSISPNDRLFRHFVHGAACAPLALPGNCAMLRAMAGGIGQSLRGLASRLVAPSPAALLRARLSEPAALPAGNPAAMAYIVFDIETTGLLPSRGDVPVQIGAVRIEAGEETACFTSLVNPGRSIPAAATRFHGIDDSMAARAPSIADALAAFAAFAGRDVLVAHNAAFDGSVLVMAERLGAPVIANPLLCSLAVARWLDPQEPDLSLDGLCGRAGLVIEGRHQALGDARATAALWHRLLGRALARGVEDLAGLVRRSRMREAIAEGVARF